MTEQELRLHRCCFTGHRPEKLNEPEKVICSKLDTAIQDAIADGFTTFITGMARGVDIWAAEIVLKYRAAGQPLKLICASSHKDFESSWSPEWQKRYYRIMETADLVRFINPSYSRACFQIRNEWMVDHSARVIAVFNGEKGGTKNTIDYAMRHKVSVNNIA